MTEENNGFSFGPRSDSPGDEEIIDAIEVGGVPVSRNEAKRMGLNFAPARKDRGVKAATSILGMNRLPPDISDDLAKKLHQAWTSLKEEKIEEALTLAQEVVWQYPDLVAAKLIIARCFIGRAEYEKALSILHAVAGKDGNAETMYYIGLAQSRMGRAREAIAALNISRASSPDSITRIRAGDLLSQLLGQITLCPVCGKRVQYDAMAEVDDRLICVNCATNVKEGEADGDDGDGESEEADEDVPTRSKRRKRLRAPLTRTDVFLRLILVVLVIGLLLFALYAFRPGYYAAIRSFIPGSGYVLPPPPYTPPSDAPARNVPDAPKAVPAMGFDSPPIASAIAGVEMRHQLRIDGMGDREGVYTAAFDPVPDGPRAMNAATGELTWTPSARDAGKTFAITFGAAFNNIQARDQRNTVTVSGGLAAEKIGVWPNPLPGSKVHILHENLSGSEEPEMVLASGLSWQGSAAIMHPARQGRSQPIAMANLAGRPVGAGIIVADAEKWLVVADFWSSRLRYFVFRDGSLSEIAASTALPGRPVLAAFSRDESISAVLCRTDAGFRLLAYAQKDQLTTAALGEWSVPDDCAWRGLFVFPPAGESGAPMLVLVGADAGRSLTFAKPGDAGTPLKGGAEGIVMDAVRERAKKRLHLLVRNDGVQRLVTVDLERGNPVASHITLGSEPAVTGLAAADLTGNGMTDVVFLGGAKAGVSFERENGERSAPYFWPLESPPLLFGTPGTTAGEGGEKVVYADAGGTLWALGLAR